ncbi:aminotransferase class I/II-fold pyridoxal phosphate-dependent enzyme [Actinomyces sp. B33]|uniref:MalY/PatB family protein n=1 Tax=Actinomyces sp. B33 TaxID=2942131 RepID=UPI00233FD725|nr:aminotransferase class I/II-fold pyridoxal phosphate-dependent enzyme [Actinomyces sp. B33]MDC4232769.1 aminotransferase class I/II-fold pyridoxal phosphate-dependent enzyme [Actinomyces sp. B33]
MPVRFFTDDHLREAGSLKWTGMSRPDGGPVIGAWVAEMDFATAPAVADAMKGAIDSGLLGYQPSWLAGAVAEATASFQEERFGWSLDPDHIRLVASVLPALRATIEHLTAPGSPVVVPTPAYMPFLTIPGELGHPVIEVPSRHGDDADGRGWALDLDGIRAGLEAGAGLVVVCNPWNPTGRVLTRAELAALDAVVADYDALVFADEIHSPLILDPATAFTSYARLSPEAASRAVTATAASKGWNIAGLPSAQVILPDGALRERWDERAAHLSHGATTIGAIGAIAAYRHGIDWLDEVCAIVAGNVAIVADALAGSPIDFTRPEGTYLTWWGFADAGLGGAPADELLSRAGVAANAGRALGAGYEQWARINLACSPDAAARIAEAALSIL